MKKPSPTNAPQQISKPRPNIAALADMLRQYKPEHRVESADVPLSVAMTFSLVNEIASIGSSPENRQKHAHTVDELIAMVGRAWPEIESLAVETAQSIHQRDTSSRVVSEMFYFVMGRHIKDDDMILDLVAARSSFRCNCEDVLRNIANNTPADKVKEVAQKFLKEFDRHEPIKFDPLVNEK